MIFLIFSSMLLKIVISEQPTLAVRLSQENRTLAEEVAAKHGLIVLDKIGDLPGYYIFGYGNRQKRETNLELKTDYNILWSEDQITRIRVKRGRTKPRLPWKDPYYRKQWYLHADAHDMKIREAWKMGYTGKGVVVTILDDGIQWDHPDLKRNYDFLASYDINDRDTDPMPPFDLHNSHGTRCAGSVAAVAGNKHCGVGVAYNAKIGGIRMLASESVSDATEGAALSYNSQHVHIYSSSWGPSDNGHEVDGPRKLAREAFKNGAEKGRGGKGSIFVWASGNGGFYKDTCSCDGYVNSIYTIPIASITYDLRKPWYLEECPATMAATYSSSQHADPAVVTTDVGGACTINHTGTSASAPIASGIIALALEANKKLTWRDVQHLIVRTSNPKGLVRNHGWVKNGAGRFVNSMFGYGLMNAKAMVKLAKKWKKVPEQNHCTLKYNQKKSMLIEKEHSKITLKMRLNDCRGQVRYLEHIQAVLTVTLSTRGQLRIYLISPAGTRSILLQPRDNDWSGKGFNSWMFTSVQQWGEDPRGVWILVVENTGPFWNTGHLSEWKIKLFGTFFPAQRGDKKNKG